MTNAAPFQTIAQACQTTGLSQYFLRNGCKDGSVPHIRCGTTYKINVPALLVKMGALKSEDIFYREEGKS